MSRYSQLVRKFRQVRKSLEQKAAILRLPSYLIYKPVEHEGPGPHKASGELLPEYREAAAEASRLRIPMKEYGFDPEALEREGIEEVQFAEHENPPGIIGPTWPVQIEDEEDEE